MVQVDKVDFRGRDKVFSVHLPGAGPAPWQWSPAVTTPHTVTGNRKTCFHCKLLSPLHPILPSFSQILEETWWSRLAEVLSKCLSEAGRGRAKHVRNSCTYTKLLYLMSEEHFSPSLHQRLTAHPTSFTLYTNSAEHLSWQQGPLVFRLSLRVMIAHGDITNFTTGFS